MCGIFAAVGQDLGESALDRVFQTLHHRGPDGRGRFIDASVPLTIAHTRLAIIDMATGAQPMESSDGEIVLSANGEIYDFERIRSELETAGHQFRTKSDSEVIIHLYKEFGLAFLEHLRGEFAFLLYDRAKRRLIAARDRFGIKPLYLARGEEGPVFASEMKAIFASGLVEPKLDAAGLDPFLEQDSERVRFPFEGVEQVPPASYVTVDLDTLNIETKLYWSSEIPAETADPVPEPHGDGPKDAAQVVLEQLEEAVRLRLRADVPVGLYLSGGIDSAFVGALMKRNLKSELHSFSISFVDSGKNEREFAARAADVIGTEHHELAVTKEALWENLEQTVWHSELPFVSLAPVGKFLLSELAHENVKVVLTGEGADEVFLGYRSFFRNAIRDTRMGTSGRSVRGRRLKMGRWAERLSLRIFHKGQRQNVARMRASSCVPEDPSKPVINAVQEGRIAAMPLDILVYLGDREEMAHSLEARLPFLDHHLYGAAKLIPVDFKMLGGLEKAVLREAANGLLPDDLRLRRKSGFMLTSEAVDFFGKDATESERLRRRYLTSEAFERAGIFSYRAYKLARLLARTPALKRLRRLRRNANKVIMYMMQTHMLHHMFIADPRWSTIDQRAG